MPSMVNYSCDNQVIDKLKSWQYGMNWPVVYIYYNDKCAYVGESLDAVRRTEQHCQESEFNQFTNICFISNKTFNKSVILDLESFLIKYMSAEGTRQLINGNAGVVDHNYFYREAYEDDFKDIWNELLAYGIVQKSLRDIENSELYKYSPYKSLNAEQQKAAFEILKRIYEINNSSLQSLIEVTGGAGTGKTILAVYLVKLLSDINRNRKVWNTIDEPDDAEFIRKLATKLSGVHKIGFVVPMNELRETMKKIFKSIDGLSDDMIYSPEEVTHDYFDLLVVDESHRLYQRNHLPGAHLYLKFDKVNKELMGESFTGTDSDLTELDWIIKSSRIQVLFYDKFQTIRATDISKERFSNICKPHVYKYIELFSQMRCKGGNGYYEYVKKVLEGNNLPIQEYKVISNYDLRVVDDIRVLFELIRRKNDGQSEQLSKVVCGPGWGKDEDIVIDGESYKWVSDIASIHKIQGFDLKYAGVIFGKELYYDKENGCIGINKAELKDNFTKSAGDDNMRQYILNIYLTLMTRGIEGTYIYAVDEDLRKYLHKFFNQ